MHGRERARASDERNGTTLIRPAAEPEAFRAQVRQWLEARYPLRDPELDDDRLDIVSRTPDGHQALVDRARKLQGELWEAGLAGPAIPEPYGGLGLSSAHASALEDELLRVDTPSLRPLAISLSLASPTILREGTEEQKLRYIPRILSGEELWCQLFSEPDAGSDLAALSTRAVFDRGEWIVSGQKVWSSYAGDAQQGLLLARTNPAAGARHSGISVLVLDMATPGVSVRPLIDIAGGSHFNEVFLSDARLPADCVLGGVDDGWRVAMATLGGERSGYLGGSGGRRRHRQVGTALGHPGRPDRYALRIAAARIVGAERVLELLNARVAAGQVADGNPAAGSLIKLAAGDLEQHVAEFVADAEGAAATAWAMDDRRGDTAAHALSASRQATIAGGTHQIQRNLVAERLLGLPR